MSKLTYLLGRAYVKAPFPLWVSVLLTGAVVLWLIYWLFF
jgi:hypothetical protein